MMTITTMKVMATNDLVFLGNSQPWLDAFLAEGWWVISTMMTAMRMKKMATMTMATAMRKILKRTYDDQNNNDNDNDNGKRPFFKAIINLGQMHSWQKGGE